MKRSSLALALLASSLVACGSARVVNRNQTGGVIALEGDRGTAMEQASSLMTDHCRGPYTVVEEGEHVVGTDTSAVEETYVADEGETLVTEGGQSTRDATEWRIKYVCGQAGPPAPQPGPPPAGPATPPPGGQPGY